MIYLSYDYIKAWILLSFAKNQKITWLLLWVILFIIFETTSYTMINEISIKKIEIIFHFSLKGKYF